jgi:hypothetical protein
VLESRNRYITNLVKLVLKLDHVPRVVVVRMEMVEIQSAADGGCCTIFGQVSHTLHGFFGFV